MQPKVLAWLGFPFVQFSTIPWVHQGKNVGHALRHRRDGLLTPLHSGYAAFLDPDVNKALKKVLNEWGKFLEVMLHSPVLVLENTSFRQTITGIDNRLT